VDSSDIEPVHHHHTGRRWLDLVLGISAISISFISLFLAIQNGKAMERLVETNSWPFVRVVYSTANVDGTPHIHLDLANKGVGPAKIQSLEMQYEGRALSGARTMLNALLKRETKAPHPRILTSSVTHSVLTAKEQISFFDVNPVDLSTEDYDAIRAGLENLHVTTCYCSVRFSTSVGSRIPEMRGPRR
jgi:hypothetical protein